MTPERILETARALVANPNDMVARSAYVHATFNYDRTAAAIVALAEGSEPIGMGVGGSELNPPKNNPSKANG